MLTYYVLTRYKVPATEQFGKSKELKKAGATRMGTNTWCPVGVVRMMGTGALEPVVGLREQRRRKIADACKAVAGEQGGWERNAEQLAQRGCQSLQGIE